MKKIATIIILCLIVISFGLYIYQRHQKTHTSYNQEQKNTPKRRKFLHNKLWRDSSAAQLEEHDGAIIHRIILNDQEYAKQLGLKLCEEAYEVSTAKDNAELIAEIGDIYEVLDCIIAHHNLSIDEIKEKQAIKREKRGSFKKREFVTVSEYLPGSFGETYTLKDSRLQEIFE